MRITPFFRFIASLALLPIPSAFAESFKLLYFARPAAWLTAVFTGIAAPTFDGEGYVLNFAAALVSVTNACSGVSFFAISLAAIFYTLSRTAAAPKELFVKLIISFASAYPFAIFANTLRIIMASYAWNIARAYLPENYFHITHMVLGMVNFMMCLGLLLFFINLKQNKNHDAN